MQDMLQFLAVERVEQEDVHGHDRLGRDADKVDTVRIPYNPGGFLFVGGRRAIADAAGLTDTQGIEEAVSGNVERHDESSLKGALTL